MLHDPNPSCKAWGSFPSTRPSCQCLYKTPTPHLRLVAPLMPHLIWLMPHLIWLMPHLIWLMPHLIWLMPHLIWLMPRLIRLTHLCVSAPQFSRRTRPSTAAPPATPPCRAAVATERPGAGSPAGRVLRGQGHGQVPQGAEAAAGS